MPFETQVIYSMNKVGRIAQSAPNKQVLRDRKRRSASTTAPPLVGVLGFNGAGKSTLLRIMWDSGDEGITAVF